MGLSAGVNLYAYVGDNPVNSIDPLGLSNAKSPKSLNCCELASEINRLSRELEERYKDEQLMQRSLLWGGMSRLLATSIWQYWRHYVHYRNVQKRVKALVDEYDGRPCNPPLTQSTKQWADKAFPDYDYLYDLWLQIMKEGPNARRGSPLPFLEGLGEPIPAEFFP